MVFTCAAFVAPVGGFRGTAVRATSREAVGPRLQAGDQPGAFTARTRSLGVPLTRSRQRAAHSNLVMKVRVAVSGFGRIGRNFVRCLQATPNANLELVGINDTAGIKTAAHLLKYDSILGIAPFDVKVSGESTMLIDGKPVTVVSNRDPTQLPWRDLNVDIVIEATGVFISRDGAGKHIEAGAKKVVITAPAKGEGVPTFVMGLNNTQYNHATDHVVSNASCTTNGMAPFVKVLDEEFGIVSGMMTTTHSYTGDQRLLDASHRDLRRARAAALNIVPTSTGAAQAVALVYPPVKGKLTGIALRVPTPNVSIVDFVCTVKKPTFKEEVNAAFVRAAEGPMKGILAVSDEPLVSSDYRMNVNSSIVDAALTTVMGDTLVKVVAWYDNEYGYSQRVVDLANYIAQHF
ncbi:glyceraldehyde-3-phosphate dehydrogenase [Cyanidioschyzon merolae strain 10D]|jgi:glyceraldehyde-3-phosphate dehydrogenase (NADP+) (phosphorylating)|uniref:Glyceraldehyde-3-phosphate dehydrogenase n=1 Tax=Cyanidioschyzon merolae (strain NIES-3377 / 10D) TaxID=280699 RepID=M1V576_CYAM1|nr:glyceraldehyde-3-phosphate dehydrogenase [Cyanidioschyzon merolae strain 10D]BAM80185.1 glyceraldehyde-3-phosphate dehydrogenase [Cyanidioschyzon merolae strain 10D]|eukprot:XP_005534792.1 glyceraldehyde-3-phosphate dehydrogenase [Cyanidioschyzon merolae strain 10D]